MMATLFGICSESCNCSEETCSLKGEQFFQITQREETPCAETTTCSVCDVFSRHLRLCALMARAHSSKNSRMTQLLASSTALHQIYTLAVPCQLSPAERVQRKAELKDLLCKIFDCKRNRLQCMKHISQLAQLLPKLLCVQLVTVQHHGVLSTDSIIIWSTHSLSPCCSTSLVFSCGGVNTKCFLHLAWIFCNKVV